MRIFEEAARLEQENVPFALVTITKSLGSTPRSQAHMIVLSDGTTLGTVGGGASEYMAVNKALELIPTGRSETVDMALTVAQGHNCGGAVEMFIEVIVPGHRLVLIGGGHVDLQIANLAASCGFHIELVETRPEFATVGRFPMVSRFHVAPTFEEALKTVEINADTALVIATHSLDRIVLDQVIGSPAFYIGMLGSRTKVNALCRHLREDLGLQGKALGRLYSPIGLDLGTETPEQIAVSVVAELMMVASGKSGRPLSRMAENLVIVRGAGDLATGIICRLHNAGYRVLALEIAQPTTIRRTVAFSEAMYTGQAVVEQVVCRKASHAMEAKTIMDEGDVALLCDPEGASIATMHPAVVVDAIIAKKNLGTSLEMAPFVVALGPGFTAPVDCHCVVETQRGHDLGRLIHNGQAQADTGIPGLIGGYGVERVLHAPAAGEFISNHQIGDMVVASDCLATVGDVPVIAQIDGVLRGLLHNGLPVSEGFKIADIDPRGNPAFCHSISDKARALGGAVLEAVDAFHAGRYHPDKG